MPDDKLTTGHISAYFEYVVLAENFVISAFNLKLNVFIAIMKYSVDLELALSCSSERKFEIEECLYLISELQVLASSFKMTFFGRGYDKRIPDLDKEHKELPYKKTVCTVTGPGWSL